jgi:rRNA maturation RNase YbeY
VPVELSCDLKRASRYTSLLRHDAATLMRLVDREYCELSILLTGDHRMRRLNSYYKFRNRPTDVLSFSQKETEGSEAAIVLGPDEYRPADAILIGDVVISLETAARQAREMRQSVSRRLRTLLIHGVLHLLGYDHERKAEAEVMFEYQDRLEAELDAASSDNHSVPAWAR